MKVLILSFLVLSASAFGAEKKIAAAAISKTSAAPKTLEIDSKTVSEEITDSTATLSNRNPIVAHVICKKSDGVELKHGDEGYEACIFKVKKIRSQSLARKPKLKFI